MKEKLNKFTKNKLVVGITSIGVALTLSLTVMNAKSSGENVKNVVVTTKKIGVGDKITDDMISYKKISGDLSNLITSKEDVVGKYAKIAMTNNDFVTNEKLSAEAIYGSAYLENLDDEERAISVSITSNAKGLSGKLESGDIVSVIVSEENEDGEKITYIPNELKYVEIINVSDNSGYDVGSDEAEKLGSTVTLLVRQEQGLILANAEGLNDIHFQLVYRGNDEKKQKLLEEQQKIIKGESLEESPTSAESTTTENKLIETNTETKTVTQKETETTNKNQ